MKKSFILAMMALVMASCSAHFIIGNTGFIFFKPQYYESVILWSETYNKTYSLERGFTTSHPKRQGAYRIREYVSFFNTIYSITGSQKRQSQCCSRLVLCRNREYVYLLNTIVLLAIKNATIPV